jgi:nucleotide-binding universal stress UspA family protein
MSTILVPLDGSPTAEQVLPYVRLLATTLKARVKLLQVVQEAFSYPYPQPHEELLVGATRGSAGFAPAPRLTAPSPELREQAEAYLSEQVRRELHGFDVEPLVHFGSPAETIVEVAEEHGATMIAMATHGYSGLRRWTLGSIADKVVQSSPTPVLVVRAMEQPSAAAPAVRRIMVPLDGSALARQALPYACDLARRSGSELVALTVAPMLAWTGSELLTTAQEVDEEAARLRARLQDDLAPFAPALREQQVKVVPVATFGVSPAAVIIGEAEDRGVDLIVMATHGYGGLRRWALGSVADKVLHGTTTPLLVVRTRSDFIA